MKDICEILQENLVKEMSASFLGCKSQTVSFVQSHLLIGDHKILIQWSREGYRLYFTAHKDGNRGFIKWGVCTTSQPDVYEMKLQIRKFLSEMCEELHSKSVKRVHYTSY